VQHARQLDVHREARGAGHLGTAIDARNRHADMGELGIAGQRRRLVGGDLALDLAQPDAVDADGVLLQARAGRGHGQLLPFLAASRTAAKTCG
jgi:hypothetical protein